MIRRWFRRPRTVRVHRLTVTPTGDLALTPVDLTTLRSAR